MVTEVDHHLEAQPKAEVRNLQGGATLSQNQLQRSRHHLYAKELEAKNVALL